MGQRVKFVVNIAADPILLVLLLALACVLGQTKPDRQSGSAAAEPAPFVSFSLSVSPHLTLFDAGILLKSGDFLDISAKPKACNPGQTGRADGWVQSLPVPRAELGALIGRLGQEDPFRIGEHFSAKITGPAELFLGTNTDGQVVCPEPYDVAVSIRPEASNAPAPAEHASLVMHLDRLPRRVNDAAGRSGDVVNFVLIGSYQSLRAALSRAHWSLADRGKMPAALHAVLATWAHEDYLQMPMSKLYCFGRTQDFGYELANPVKVAASRHHFRLWLVPWQFDGLDLWVGAATHDIGFTKDRRNGHLTHKIDPNVDDERDFVLHTLGSYEVVDSSFYFLPSDPVRQAFNATGGSFYSDGRVLVLTIQGNPVR